MWHVWRLLTLSRQICPWPDLASRTGVGKFPQVEMTQTRLGWVRYMLDCGVQGIKSIINRRKKYESYSNMRMIKYLHQIRPQQTDILQAIHATFSIDLSWFADHIGIVNPFLGGIWLDISNYIHRIWNFIVYICFVLTVCRSIVSMHVHRGRGE